MVVLTYQDRNTPPPLDQRKIDELVRLFRYYPLLNKTMLNYGMGMGGPKFERELQALVYTGTLSIIPHRPSSGLADRYCLSSDLDLLLPFAVPLEVPQSYAAIAGDPLERMKAELINSLTLYPILIRSFLAAAVNTKGSNFDRERQELVHAGIVGELPAEPRSRRAVRYYLRELEDIVQPFFGEDA